MAAVMGKEVNQHCQLTHEKQFLNEFPQKKKNINY